MGSSKSDGSDFRRIFCLLNVESITYVVNPTEVRLTSVIFLLVDDAHDSPVEKRLIPA